MAVIASEHINEPEIGPSKIGPSIKNTHVGFSGRVIVCFLRVCFCSVCCVDPFVGFLSYDPERKINRTPQDPSNFQEICENR